MTYVNLKKKKKKTSTLSSPKPNEESKKQRKRKKKKERKESERWELRDRDREYRDPFWLDLEACVDVVVTERAESERVWNPALSETYAGESETHAATRDEIHLPVPAPVAIARSA